MLGIRQLLSPFASSCRRIPISHSYARDAVTSSAASRKPSSSSLVRIVDGLYKTYKPITPGIRHLRRPLTPYLYNGDPLRLLTIPKRKTGGRNANGRITIRGRGGGHKQRIRTVDFIRKEPGVQDVVRIEYDPGRSGHIALVKNRDPESKQPWSYILAPEGLRAGQTVQSFREGIPDGLIPGFVDVGHVKKKKSKISSGFSSDPSKVKAGLALGQMRSLTLKVGNVLPLRLIPTGTQIHAVALHPERRMVLLRSAGTYGTVVAHEEKGVYSQIRLQSGEVRKVLQTCPATIGRVGNILHDKIVLGKAGRNRWLGRRPKVRGMAMNAVDHPHGGGRGKSKGNKHPRSPWGWLTKGKRTRKPGPKGPKNSNKMVVKERPRGVEKREGRRA
ncbi:translation protein SH3-like domain-containing protein [Hysterangium stoloniferum]|nr:translation protein SH3-like domain-containing protein [Hysterangium stoloniferum]